MHNVILYYWYCVHRIYIFLYKVVARARKFHWYDKKLHWDYINTLIPKYLIFYPMINKSRSHVLTTRRFLFYMKIFLSLLLNPYISNISNLHNLNKNMRLSSQKIYDRMFSDPKSDHTSHVFWLRTWLIYFFFSYVEIFHLLRRP